MIIPLIGDFNFFLYFTCSFIWTLPTPCFYYFNQIVQSVQAANKHSLYGITKV